MITPVPIVVECWIFVKASYVLRQHAPASSMRVDPKDSEDSEAYYNCTSVYPPYNYEYYLVVILYWHPFNQVGYDLLN